MIEVGATIGPYKIVEKLGEGGMGAVYKAVHEAIERTVAIKVLHPEFAKIAEFTGRFFNEARAVNRIDHPGVVQVGDFGELSDGTAYIVMEYLRGESLAARLEKADGPIPLASALNIAAQVADTLAVAHEKGIIHRDLKPDNIMLVSDRTAPGGERTKLLDFGIAKLTHDANQAGVKTRTSAVMGTPHFMSPEQCKGGKNVDDKADVYSFGILLFVLISGSYPFDGDGVGDIMGKHLFEPPPSLKSAVPDTPDPLVTLVTRMLAKNKEERPRMAEVAETLAALSRSAPVQRKSTKELQQLSPEPPRPSQLNLPLAPPPISAASRGRVALLLSAVVLASATGATVTWLLRSGKSTPTPPDSSATKATRLVRWQVDSQPAGADVIRISDGVVLGRTPWESTRESSLGQLQIKLRLAGYAERQLDLDLAADCSHSEMLVATAGAATEVSRSTAADTATATGDAGARTAPKAEARGGAGKKAGKGKKGEAAAGKAPGVGPQRRFEEE